MEIPLTQSKVAHIDDEGWPLVSPNSWHAKLENGYLWYADASIPVRGPKLTLKMHDLIMPPGPGRMVDQLTLCDVRQSEGAPPRLHQ
jgi:hypothetical protein